MTIIRVGAALGVVLTVPFTPAQTLELALGYGDPGLAQLNGARVGDRLGEGPLLIPRRGGDPTFIVQVWGRAPSTFAWSAALGFLGYGRGDAGPDPFADREAFLSADLDARLAPARPTLFAEHPGEGWPDAAGGPDRNLEFAILPTLRGVAGAHAGPRPLGSAVFLVPPPGESVRWLGGEWRHLYDVALLNRGLAAGERYGDTSNENGLTLNVAGGLDDGQNLFLDATNFDAVYPAPKAYVVQAAPTVRLQGRVTVSPWLGPEPLPALRVEFRATATGPMILTETVQPGNDGRWFLDVPLEGLFEARLKPDRGLAVNLGELDLRALTASVSEVALTLGDLDGDNAVTVFDYDALSAAFDSTIGGPAWNPLADLDGDGAITVFDYDVLSRHFDRVGD